VRRRRPGVDATLTGPHDITPATLNHASATEPAAPWTYADIAMALVAVIIGTIVTGAIGGVIANTFLQSGEEYEDNAAAFTIVLIPSMVVMELLLLGATAWFGHWKHKVPWTALGLRPGHASWWLPAVLAIASLAMVYGYAALLSVIGLESASTPDEVFEKAGPFIVVLIGAVVLAPPIEEMFFRGFLFGGLRARRGWVLAAVVSSLVFALAHLDIYGVPAYAAIGFLFAWAYHHTASLKPSMIAHALVNAVTVGVAFATSGSI
jgi:membrane protease YdiL (CAAX protease family)